MGQVSPTQKQAPAKKRKPGQPSLFALMSVVVEREIRHELAQSEDTIERRANGEPVCYLVS